MQQSVENYDFNKHYLKTKATRTDQAELIAHDQDVLHNSIIMNTFIYTNRALNITVSYFKHGPEINPYLIFRFDVRQINDLTTFRVGATKKEHWIIAACNDGYLKVFSPQKGNLIKAIKGISGNPICVDVSGLGHIPSMPEQRDLLAVGYEDDSFMVYSILRDF